VKKDSFHLTHQARQHNLCTGVPIFNNGWDKALRPGVIKISGSVAQGRATYIVEDNGIGIAPQHQNKIFELFNRLNPSTSKGDGLGLALARQILNRLDGKIRVESGLDQGSKFFTELPGKIKLIDKQGG
jgi:signal transduction histidine kinase